MKPRKNSKYQTNVYFFSTWNIFSEYFWWLIAEGDLFENLIFKHKIEFTAKFTSRVSFELNEIYLEI